MGIILNIFAAIGILTVVLILWAAIILLKLKHSIGKMDREERMAEMKTIDAKKIDTPPIRRAV